MLLKEWKVFACNTSADIPLCNEILEIMIPVTMTELSRYKIFRGMGQWAVYYTSPQSFMITFCYSILNNFGDFYWIWLVGLLGVQTFQPLISIYKRGNFVCHHWGYTSIYRPLAYPFRSLQISVQKALLHLLWIHSVVLNSFWRQFK